MINNILENLNQEQQEAVKITTGYHRIIAGAGCGKTTVLSSKIIYLIQCGVTSSNKILALTFSNKAAQEMKNRVSEYLTSVGICDEFFILPTITTFHAFCVKVLRKHLHHLPNFRSDFTIMDTVDKKTVLKKIIKNSDDAENNTEEIKIITNLISKWKNNHRTVNNLKTEANGDATFLRRIKYFELYQQEQLNYMLLDFDDLLLLALKLFKNYPEILSYWQNYYHFVLVDEFQDTNQIQFEIVRLISALKQNLSVVGDPDQTIYGWRGADINLIMKFNEFFPQAQTSFLTHNYRSTDKILKASNQLIGFNKDRLPKQLVSANNHLIEKDILLFKAQDNKNEAFWVCQQIKKLLQQKLYAPQDIAILYRNNYQSQDIEQNLILFNIEYRIVGGFKFFERKEIKDAISYLRVIAFKDRLSLLRILRLIPKIGPKTIDNLEQKSIEANMDLFDWCLSKIGSDEKFLKKNILDFILLIQSYRAKINNIRALKTLLEEILTKTGYLKKTTDTTSILNEEEEERLKNILQLLDYINEFDKTSDLTGEAKLIDFLEEVSLYTDIENKNNRNVVNCSTMHAAKGLEFPVVFIIGINEMILPALKKNTVQDNTILEEERRLFYVGLTRAKKELFLSYSLGFSVIMNSKLVPSRFIHELGSENVQHYINYCEKNNFNLKTKKKNETVLKPKKSGKKITKGMFVKHLIFGKGTVSQVLKDRLVIIFNQDDKKTIKVINDDNTLLEFFS